MHKIKFFLVFLSLVIYLAFAYLSKLLLIFAKKSTRLKILNWQTVLLCRVLKYIGGIHLHIEGNKELLKQKGQFFIANHIGYVDGIVMGSLLPGSFIAKIEILKMLLINKVIEVCDTIFIDSRKKSEIIRYNKEMADRLKEGINVLIFPEGHCTDGTHILPFYSAYFDVPIKAKCGIIPISVEFVKVDGKPIQNRQELCFLNGSPFFPHLLNLLKFKRIDVRVKVHDMINTQEYASNGRDRKFIADYAHGLMVAYKRSVMPETIPVGPSQVRARQPIEVYTKSIPPLR